MRSMHSLIPLLLLAACDGCNEPPPDSEPGDTAPPAETDVPDTGDTEEPDETGDTAPPPPDPAPVSDLEASVHAEVVTILEVSWTQDEPMDEVWVEYRFETEDWLSTPVTAWDAGAASQVVLGIPAETEVELRVANGDPTTLHSEPITATTGALPFELTLPMLISYDPTIASEHPWVMGSLDVTGSSYGGPCWSFIVDREARVVWYHEVPDSRLNLFTQVSADGTHILIDGTTNYVWGQGIEPIVDRYTLDKRYNEHFELPDLRFSFDEIPGGSILYDASRQDKLLIELYPDGSEREIFNCDRYAQEAGYSSSYCSVNSVVYNEGQGTVFWSQYSNDTVIEIDYATGDVVRRFGQARGGWAFDPEWTEVDYQHYPNYSPDGTVMASTHSRYQSGVQYAHEYVVDDKTETMVAIWSYGDEVLHYAQYGGEAFRLDNGNTFITYGTDGAIREVTMDRRTAWELEWPADPSTHLMGHFSFIDDLYALNEGPADVQEVAR
jgi:hypothetical protein